MDVRMAILALVADIVEHHLDVAGCAGYADVHAAQGIRRLIVIEFWNGPDGLPTLSGVAVRAREVEAAVWTLGRGNALRLPNRMRRGEQNQDRAQSGQSFHRHHSLVVWNRPSKVPSPNSQGGTIAMQFVVQQE